MDPGASLFSSGRRLGGALQGGVQFHEICTYGINLHPLRPLSYITLTSSLYARRTMVSKNRRNSKPRQGLQKERTGISGFDEITGGGLPQGRPALICGSAGAGKTLFA